MINRFVFFSSLFSTMISLLFLYGGELMSLINLICFIPVLYGVLFFIFIPRLAYWGPGWTVLNILMYLRYVVFTPFYVFNAFKSSVVDSYSYFYVFITLFIFVFELVFIFVFSNYFIKKYYRRSTPIKFFQSNNFFVLIVLIVLALLVIGLNPAVLLNFNFVFDTTKFADETFSFGDQEFVFGSGTALEFVKYTIFFINLFVFEKFLLKYKFQNKLKYILFAIIPFMISSLFYIGISRSSILIPFIACLFLLVKYFGKDSLKIVPILGFYILVLVLSLTFFKQFRTGSVNEGFSEFSSVDFFSNFLNDYTSSFPNVYSGYVNYEKVLPLIKPETLVNDYLSVIPFFHKYADLSNRTSVLFNKPFSSNYKTAHRITPLSIQGIMHLGFPFFVLYPIITIFLIFRFDYLFRTSNNIYYSFAFALISCGIGFSLGHTFTFHVLGRIIRVLIPVLMFMFLLRLLARFK